MCYSVMFLQRHPMRAREPAVWEVFVTEMVHGVRWIVLGTMFVTPAQQWSTGTGFSAPEVWYAGAFSGTRATLAADVDGDGDLVAVNSDEI